MGEADSYYHSEAERYFQAAFECQNKGELHEAIELYRKSLDFFPTAEAHTFLGWAYSHQGQYDQAIQECYKAIRVDPDYGNPYNDIGAYLIEKGDLDAAVPWLQKAILAKRYESYCYPHYNLGRIWEVKGNWVSALESYQKALEENPQYTLAQDAVTRLQGILN